MFLLSFHFFFFSCDRNLPFVFSPTSSRKVRPNKLMVIMGCGFSAAFVACPTFCLPTSNENRIVIAACRPPPPSLPQLEMELLLQNSCLCFSKTTTKLLKKDYATINWARERGKKKGGKQEKCNVIITQKNTEKL